MDELSSDLEILPEWMQATRAILARPGVVVLLGGSDSGKTTLARILAGAWTTAGRTVGLVDGDIGQSSVGPPTTVGLTILAPGSAAGPFPAPWALSFVGSTSPPGHFLAHILGTQALVHMAIAEGAEIVLVDTTGLIQGPVAASLKWHKLQAIRPQYVLALQRETELEPILHLVEGRSDMLIQRLPVSSRVVRRSLAARRAFREEQFRDYFAAAEERELSWKDLCFSRLWLNTGRRVGGDGLEALGAFLQTMPLYAEVGTDEALVFVRGPFSRSAVREVRRALQVAEVLIVDVEQLPGTLVGLHDRDNVFLALGILRRFDPEREGIQVFTPYKEPGRIWGVAFGALCLGAGGKELGEARWR
jgi:polynucleotide 5'-hydroxyl-kinase GRC3/NOL9